jgi:prepilin-type N-terminal cleavage/methylation domain-containing protein
MKPRNRLRFNNNSRAHAQSGFSALELLFVIAVIGVVSGFAVVRLTAARQNMRLMSDARVFSGYVEKARLDAIRRHGGTITSGTPAPPTVQFLNDTSYSVTMDFTGAGTNSTRVVNLRTGVKLLSNAPLPIVFDWRGRTNQCLQSFSLWNGQGVTVDITGSGDVTIDGDSDNLSANVSYTNVNSSADISGEAVVNGNVAPPASTTPGDCASALMVGSTGTATFSGCGGSSITPALVTIKKNGGSTGTFTVTVGTPTTVTATSTSNISVTPASQAITSSGNFTVRSLNNLKSTYDLIFNSPCFASPQIVKVRIIN